MTLTTPSIHISRRNPTPVGGAPIFEAAEAYAADWRGEGVRLPIREVAELPEGEPAAYLVFDGMRVPAVVERGGTWEFAFDPFRLMDDILLERCYPPMGQPVTSLLPFHYHTVPGAVRTLLARLMTLGHRGENDDGPEESSLEYLRAFLIRLGLLRPTVWPEGKRWAFCTTHDVDTAAGFARIPDFIAVERARGMRAQWNIVADHYPIDWGLLKELEGEGDEIASHGLNHDNRLAFLPEPEMRDRFRRIRATFEGKVNLRGFRSPSLLVSPLLFDLLPEFFAYDSSVCDLQIDNGRGCRSLFPFRRGAGIVEIPITLDMDSSLIFRGASPAVILKRWTAKLARIKAVGGLAVLVTHTEPHFSGNRPMLDLYARILDVVRHDTEVWITTPASMRVSQSTGSETL